MWWKINENIRESIKEIYAQEARMNIKDPNFWEKLNRYIQKRTNEENAREPEICPCYGQEIEKK